MNKEKKYIKGSRCLVVGGNGFIGMRVVTMLLDAGAKEIVVLERSRGFIKDHRLRYVVCDLTKKISVGAIKKLGAFDYIFNLVGMTDQRIPHPNPVALLDANVRTLVHLTQGIAWESVAGAVHVGSSAEYGVQPLPYHENMSSHPMDMYGWSKASASSYACIITRSGFAKWCVARPFFVYGPGKHTGFIPNLMKVLSRGKTFTVAGKSTRDPVFVDDVAIGLIRLALCPSACGEIVNICNGKEISIARIAAIVRQKIGKGDIIVNPLMRTGDILRSRGSIKKLKKLTGWSPHTNFSQGLDAILKEYHL